MFLANAILLGLFPTHIMPAVPAPNQPNNNENSLTDKELTSLVESHEDITTFRVENAFEILHDDYLDTPKTGPVFHDSIDLENFHEEIFLNYNEDDKSYENNKVINSSNSHIFCQKLMELSQSNHSLNDEQEDKKQNGFIKNSSKILDKLNNLKQQKIFSKSNGNLPNQQKYQPKRYKPISKSSNKLEGQNGNKLQQTQNSRDDHKGYHKYCHVSPSKYLNNIMTSLKSKSYYDREFSNINNGTTMGRRKSSPDFDPYMPGERNNNIRNNMKKKQNEKHIPFYNKNNNINANGHKMNNNGLDKNQQRSENKRPMFVTTVKTGTFLEPPPEVAYILGLTPSWNNSPASSTNDSSNSLNSTSKDRHQQQVLLYSFSSQPRVLNQQYHRSRCDAALKSTDNHSRRRRDTSNTTSRKQNEAQDDGPVTYSNIMFDRRVIRGSTFAQHPIPPKWNPYFGYAKLLSKTDEGETQTARQHEARRRALARRRAQADQYKNKGRGTPPPVTGRRHENVQTEKFLEELLERPSETEASCQTDPFLDRPVSPPFIPAVVTAEAETQVYPGELFDFNDEVEPILDVLVGKTLEQSIAEVIEEEQEVLKVLQHSEQMGQQTKKESQDKQKSGANEDSEAEKDSSQGVLSLEYLPETLPDVLAGLKHAGYNINDIKTDFGEDIMPWLLKEVQNELKHMVSSKDILTDIVREIVETRGEVYRVMKDEDAEILDLGSDDESTKKDEETKEQEENPILDLENADQNIASDEPNQDMEQMEDCENSSKNQRELESKMSEHNKEDLEDNKEIVDEEDTNNDLELSARVEENEAGSVKHLISETSEIEEKKTQENGEVES